MKLAGTDVLIPKVSRRAFVLLWYQMNSWVSTLIQDSDNHPSTYTVTRLIFWVARITTLAKYPAPGTSKTTDPTVSSSPQIQMGFVWRRDTKDSIVYHLIMSFRKLKIYSTFGSLESFPNHHESSQIDITPRPNVHPANITIQGKTLFPTLLIHVKKTYPLKESWVIFFLEFDIHYIYICWNELTPHEQPDEIIFLLPDICTPKENIFQPKFLSWVRRDAWM